ncbi:Arc family DNA-binding protein [Acetobacter orientalis]|uniref:Arc family DNA-binding protein n=1 Tax=Acetobacter orientalis TaxID=146474 RepID=UPI00241D2637|nr:Arc family DNA-binding protein [Acetobacter orientalis]
MSNLESQIHVRVPARLKAEIENAAKASGRSMNAEIVYRLEAGIPDDLPVLSFLREEATELEFQIDGLKRERADQSAQAKDYEKIGGDLVASAILRMEIRATTARLIEAESRLRRIKRVLGE